MYIHIEAYTLLTIGCVWEPTQTLQENPATSPPLFPGEYVTVGLHLCSFEPRSCLFKS